MQENKLENSNFLENQNHEKDTKNFMNFLEENELDNLIILSEIFNNPNIDKNEFNI